MTDTAQWYQLPAADVFKRLGADSDGLTSAEVLNRLKTYGPNELVFKKPSTLMRFLRQFHSPLVYVLLVAAAITGVLTLRGEHMLPDTLVILSVVVLNTILGFIQEGKAEAALEALRRMIVPESTVLRDGMQRVVPTRELVPGDVVLLESGSRVPADLRLFFAKDVNLDESVLTGESAPVEKDTAPIPQPNLAPADQRCMTFSGTFVTRGSARGIVVTTAENTEFGMIVHLVKETRREATPLQKKIAGFTKALMVAIFVLGGANLLLGYFVGFSVSYSFLASVSLVVAAMPEMLPMLVTSILALGAAAMAKRNALVRRLPAAETLGSVTVICSDKTGTLTKNEMTVVRAYSGGRDYRVTGVGYDPSGEFISGSRIIDVAKDSASLGETLRAGLSCSNAALERDDSKYSIAGDPTEGALVVVAAKAGITDRLARLDEIPFESEQMYMATLHERPAGNIIYVKGSPEKVLAMSTAQMLGEAIEPLNAAAILQQADEMAADGLRVLAMSYKTVASDKRSVSREDMGALVFLGLQGMIDPPREEAIEAIRKCRKAGIRPLMITGDHLKTAKSIARQLGILRGDEDGAVTGAELAAMSDQELYEALDKLSVYARVTPEHKLRIAQQLKKRGHIVAMTGDGVNDAPALRAADIGVAMGITGTEVSREAAAMVLADDNFASIVAAVEEGRHAWNNLEKAILYTLPTNGGQALLVMGAMLLAPFIALFSMRLPLEPIQILWINLFDSVFLTVPLMMEPKEAGLLEVAPRDPKAKIANRLFIERVGLVSLLMTAMGFIIFWIFGHAASGSQDTVLTQAQTAVLISIVMVHLGYVMTARSIFKSAFSLSPFSNKWLLAGITVTIVTNLMMVYAPFMHSTFRTAAFPAEWWPYVLIGLPVGFFIPELEKLVRRRLSAAAVSRSLG